jgi:hypothetical protein
VNKIDHNGADRRSGRCESRAAWHFRSILGLVLFLFLLNIPANADAITTIKNVRFDPKPNYKLCTDPQDNFQIIDQKVEKHPIWIRKGCVGWQQKGAVKLFLEMAEGSNELPISGTLSFHTGQKDGAGVKLPAHIDVYTKKQANEYYFAGSISSFKKRIEKNTIWLSVDLANVYSSILIIIHPDGQYLFLDEIRWQDKLTKKINISQLVGNIQDCENDSKVRHRKAIAAAQQLLVPKWETWRKAFPKNQIVHWIAKDPYGKLPVLPPVAVVQKRPKKLRVIGVRSEREVACIGLVATKTGGQNINVSIDASIASHGGIEIASLGNVLAANGEKVYDPIVPFSSKGVFNVASGHASYLWLTADMSKLPAGNHRFFIKIQKKDGGQVLSIPCELTVIDKALSSSLRPYAITWAYVHDMPIWRQPQKNITDLIDHGINVFVVHGSDIPVPMLDGRWDTAKSKRLEKNIKLFKGKGLILLYLEWGGNRNPAWLKPLTGKDRYAQRRAIQKWALRIAALFTKNGVSPKKWAFYPIDEVKGSNANYLREIAFWLKEANPDIQIYANPNLGRKPKTTLADLYSLDMLVDYWQPEMELLQSPAAVFFKTVQKPWWIYENNKLPAKALSPWRHYRFLSWFAWQAGATGVGVWSYSDTSGSSAWDDLDGRRADWAMVYEGKGHPISSRRWEAFREGLEDFQLLEYAARQRSGSRHSLRSTITQVLDKKQNATVFYAIREDVLRNMVP